MKPTIGDQILKGTVRDLHLFPAEIYVDHEKTGRSGHMSHAMTEFRPGKIIAFNSNCSGKRLGGHAAYGWIEYRISEDYGKTFGPARKLPYAWECFIDGLKTISVEKAVSLPDGTIAAFLLRNSQSSVICCEPWDTPYITLSHDGGDTWEEPFEISPYRGRIYDAVIHDGKVYFLEFCNDASVHFCGNRPDHLYRIYVSEDGCRSFHELAVVPFPTTFGRAYGNFSVTPEGSLIVYAYNMNAQDQMDYIISKDWGISWEAPGTCYVAKCIRNPQVGILDGQYILHGRAGEYSDERGEFVFYTSADGIHWDEGKILVSGKPCCFYSNNLTVRCPDGKDRLLVQYSENYGYERNDPYQGDHFFPNDWSEKFNCRVNVMHLWIESV